MTLEPHGGCLADTLRLGTCSPNTLSSPKQTDDDCGATPRSGDYPPASDQVREEASETHTHTHRERDRERDREERRVRETNSSMKELCTAISQIVFFPFRVSTKRGTYLPSV